jgi:sortase A
MNLFFYDYDFKVLKDLNLGDKIRVQYKKIDCQVAKLLIVDQNQAEVIQDYGSEQLTLITCYPFNSQLRHYQIICFLTLVHQIILL